MENLRLDNGKYLNRDFGKYGTGLILITKKPINTYSNSIEEQSQRIGVKFIQSELSEEDRELLKSANINSNFIEAEVWDKLLYGENRNKKLSDDLYRAFERRTFNNKTKRTCHYKVAGRLVKCRFLQSRIKEKIPFTGQLATLAIGEFRTNKKGNKVFEVTPTGKDVLVKIMWGGTLRKGSPIVEDEIKNIPYKYLYRNKSNGGGKGYDTIIVPFDYIVSPRSNLSEDDF